MAIWSDTADDLSENDGKPKNAYRLNAAEIPTGFVHGNDRPGVLRKIDKHFY